MDNIMVDTEKKEMSICSTCVEAWNAINGRYCSRLGRYVNIKAAVPPCSNKVISRNGYN